MTTNMKDLFKAIEQLKKYVGDYTYKTVYDYGAETFDEELQHPIKREVQAPTPENLSDEEWNNLMGNIGVSN